MSNATNLRSNSARTDEMDLVQVLALGNGLCDHDHPIPRILHMRSSAVEENVRDGQRALDRSSALALHRRTVPPERFFCNCPCEGHKQPTLESFKLATSATATVGTKCQATTYIWLTYGPPITPRTFNFQHQFSLISTLNFLLHPSITSTSN